MNSETIGEIDRMKRLLGLAFIYFWAIGMAIADPPTLLTFDDLPTPSNGPGAIMPIGYGGLQWNNFGYLEPHGSWDGGYWNGMVSRPHVAGIPDGNPATISRGTPFNLSSAYMTAVCNEGLQLEVRGFIGSTLAYDKTYTLNTTAPLLANFSYLGVDTVVFSASGGVKNDNYPSLAGPYFAMDDLTFSVVPEPSLFVLGLGAVVLVVARRKFL